MYFSQDALFMLTSGSYVTRTTYILRGVEKLNDELVVEEADELEYWKDVSFDSS